MSSSFEFLSVVGLAMPFIILGADAKNSSASFCSTLLERSDSCRVISEHCTYCIFAKKSGFLCFSCLANVLNDSASSSSAHPWRIAYKHCKALSYKSPFMDDSISLLIILSICSMAGFTRSSFRSVIILLKSAIGLIEPISFTLFSSALSSLSSFSR